MDGISIDFIYAEPPSSGELKSALTHLFEWGSCTTRKDSGPEQVSYFLGWDGESKNLKSEPSVASEELSERKAGSVKLFLQGTDGFDPLAVSIQFIDDSIKQFHIDAPDQFIVSVHVDNVYLDPMKRSDDELVEYSKRLLALTKTLYEVTNPIHVVGFRVMPGVEESFFPVSTLEIGDVEIIRPVDWLAIFTTDTLNRVGTGWATEDTSWKTERLDDGSLLLVLAPHPADISLDERLEQLGEQL